MCLFKTCQSIPGKLNTYSTKLIYLNFQSHKVVSRYRDPQPQVVVNYSHLLNMKEKKILILMLLNNNTDLIC